MATTDFWQRVTASVSSPSEWAGEAAGGSTRSSQGKVKLWMLMDVLTVILSALLATTYELHTGPVAGARRFYSGKLFYGLSMEILLALLCGFVISLLIISRRLHLYSRTRLTSFLHEQRLSVQACFTAGLLLTGTLYLIHGEVISRRIVLVTLGMVTVALSLRRLIYRIVLHRRFDRGLDTRNVVIVGTGPEAHALRHHLESIRHLGFTFKGFIELPGNSSSPASNSSDVVGTLDTLFQHARKQFVDEIFFTAPCDQAIVQDVLEKARTHGVDLRLVPDMYGGLAWNCSIEYIGQFPTIPLHCGRVPEVGMALKRVFDVLFSSLVLLLLSPLLLAIAIAIKLNSPGPVFYASERIGKKGRVFHCLKFRTMVRDAEKRRADIMHMNERDGVLFKITNDPRVTKLGRFLRKYSLDELPQFFNVLHGDMSVVGPRPPIASEVKEYKLSHLRRLDVMPGITGLWQVQARQDPSFDSYVSLDVTYIEKWSIWLDVKILVRTIGVVFSGTGT
ncbi:MAG: sugar transferase [Terracidiphilus sp.]|jgi:exopolysaccharide biosynthesis polyprenyl glycosylphosphotransferase